MATMMGMEDPLEVLGQVIRWIKKPRNMCLEEINIFPILDA
jgi:hypothetical protein